MDWYRILEAKFYIYAQTMEGRTQYGIVGCAACEDYMNGVIKKHELTRPDKEEDRMVLTRYVNANLEPVFFAYRAVPEIDAIVEDIVKNQKADYDFVAEDGFGHHFWAINCPETNKRLEELSQRSAEHLCGRRTPTVQLQLPVSVPNIQQRIRIIPVKKSTTSLWPYISPTIS